MLEWLVGLDYLAQRLVEFLLGVLLYDAEVRVWRLHLVDLWLEISFILKMVLVELIVQIIQQLRDIIIVLQLFDKVDWLNIYRLWLWLDVVIDSATDQARQSASSILRLWSLACLALRLVGAVQSAIFLWFGTTHELRDLPVSFGQIVLRFRFVWLSLVALVLYSLLYVCKLIFQRGHYVERLQPRFAVQSGIDLRAAIEVRLKSLNLVLHVNIYGLVISGFLEMLHGMHS